MFNLNSSLESADEQDIEMEQEQTHRGRGRPRGSGRNLQGMVPDAELVAAYKVCAEQYGPNSFEAEQAFEPIYTRYWPQVYSLALGKIGSLHAEDLAQETLQTVWERLNGREIVTNLRGLVRHSFEREYVTLLEKLLQGRKLQRARQAERNQSGAGNSEEPERIKGAVVVSLNATALGAEGEQSEIINLVEDTRANVVDAATRLEQARVLRELIDQMPSQYRGPLVCQWLLGMKIKHVAEELNLTIDQVKHNTARGIIWLRKRMPGQPDDWLL